ncbi:MAG TPA: M14 family zinc carboxypeptidase [Mycobacteriales bacterium]|nr:M14 family zinc carboxypeptidase [Mycobacteriales bacterium]
MGPVRRSVAALGLSAALTGGLLVLAPVAHAAPLAPTTPVCTDGFKGGPPLAACGLRIFPEAAVARSYVQYAPDPTGFREYADGLLFLEKKYPRWVDVFTLDEHFKDKRAVTAGPDAKRSFEEGDTGDGRKIWVLRLTDKQAPDKDKKKLFFSLSVHGNERGGLEGGLRAAEDLAMEAEANTGSVPDGVPNYTSNTGTTPEIHSYPPRELLAKEDVYFVDFNIDGWEAGDHYNAQHFPENNPPAIYGRENSMSTDLNRQMPTKGWIDNKRNPLTESEMSYGTRLMDELAAGSPGGLMAYGADIHGEINSRAYVDIMYPAGQFGSIKHRQLMAIAERTKSVIDKTLYAGIQDEIENQTGGNEGEGVEEDIPCHLGPPDCKTLTSNTIPTKPAHWATVWDTLGYTDTGFIGDYLAAEVSVTGMDYEIALNHTVPDKVWNVYLQENHINASRGIIKTAMAYALYQDTEFAKFQLETGGQAGYVDDPTFVRSDDANGVGEKPGPAGDGIGQDGKPVVQHPYKASRMQFFRDQSKLMTKPFRALQSGDIAADAGVLDQVDSLVLADLALPKDGKGRSVDKKAYFANLKSWVQKGGNLVLTDRAIHALGDLGLVAGDAITDFTVYQPYADITNFSDPLVAGLRSNARQLVEAPILGYGIGETASPMTGVSSAAFSEAGGKTVGTTEQKVTLGHLELGKGKVQVIGGALPTQTEEHDHRFGLKDYALTYSGLFIMENATRYDAPGLGAAAPTGFKANRPGTPPVKAPSDRKSLAATGGDLTLAVLGAVLLGGVIALRRRRRTA